MNTKETEINFDLPLEVCPRPESRPDEWLPVVGDVMFDQDVDPSVMYGVYYRDAPYLMHAWVGINQLRNKPKEPKKYRATIEVDLLTNGSVVVRRVTHENCTSDAGPFFVESREIVIEWEVPHEG